MKHCRAITVPIDNLRIHRATCFRAPLGPRYSVIPEIRQASYGSRAYHEQQAPYTFLGGTFGRFELERDGEVGFIGPTRRARLRIEDERTMSQRR